MITNEVAFVAIAVSDKERARKFYQETLELTPTRTQMDGAWVEYDLGPTTIGVGCHPAWKPSRDGTTVAFEVEDIDAAYTKLKERGVTFDMEKTETPVCWMAQFRDPDGNKLVIHNENDEARMTNVEANDQMTKPNPVEGSSGIFVIRFVIHFVIRHSSFVIPIMSVLVDKNTRLVVQGITGSAGAFHTRQCMDTAPTWSPASRRGKAAKCSMAKCRCSILFGKRDKKPDERVDGVRACACRCGFDP